MALKFVDDVDEGVFDDEITSTKIAYLANHFQNFLKNNNTKARSRNVANPKKMNKPRIIF